MRVGEEDTICFRKVIHIMMLFCIGGKRIGVPPWMETRMKKQDRMLQGRKEFSELESRLIATTLPKSLSRCNSYTNAHGYQEKRYVYAKRNASLDMRIDKNR
jgi:hypothetical protein